MSDACNCKRADRTKVALVAPQAIAHGSGHHGRRRHWFRQCTRPIHSARRQEPSPDASPCRRRTGSVGRQSAARGSRSPERPPLAASLPARQTDGARVRRRHISRRGLRSPERHHYPSALSSLLAVASPPGRRRRVVTALPRTVVAWTTMSEPSPRTPRELPLSFYLGHSPPPRRFAARAATSTRPTKPSAELAKARRPRWFLR